MSNHIHYRAAAAAAVARSESLWPGQPWQPVPLPPGSVPPTAASRSNFYYPAITCDPEIFLMPAFLVLLFCGRGAVQPGSVALPPCRCCCLLLLLILLPLRRQPAPAAHSGDQTQRQLGKQLGAKLERLFK